MHLLKSIVITAAGAINTAAFTPCLTRNPAISKSCVPLKGYLDDITKELYSEDGNPDPEAESREATKMTKDQIENFGPGTLADYVDFGDEFDGGDGQMGVAGDGNKQLEKMDNTPTFATSKMMSAKNAWGTETGYADVLRSQNPKMDTARAQQLENWANQQEVRMKTQQMKEMSDSFDSQQTSAEENWRQLAKFGVERNEKFDMDEAFGPVTPGDTIDGVIELVAPGIGKVATYELPLRNPYMGFADFRAAFTSDTPMDWSIEPNEGSLMQKEDTKFIVKFKPQGMGLVSGYLVIETEDFKKTYQVTGST